MTTNTDMTLYHKVFNTETRLDEWKKYLIEHVMWQGGKGASLNKGYEQANDVRVWIPKDVNNLTDVVFSIGDIMVKGNISQEISKQSDLKIDNVYNITTVLGQDLGSEIMDHIELGGK